MPSDAAASEAFSLNLLLCPSPKRSGSKTEWETRGERQQIIPSYQDGTWACVEYMWPHGNSGEGAADTG